MHADEKKPTGSGNYPAGHADAAIVQEADSASIQITAKEFAKLQAEFALRGHVLERAADQCAGGFYAARCGMVRELATVADVRLFLARIGGAA